MLRAFKPLLLSVSEIIRQGVYASAYKPYNLYLFTSSMKSVRQAFKPLCLSLSVSSSMELRVIQLNDYFHPFRISRSVESVRHILK